MSNPFNCNCHLSWLPEWLKRKTIVSGRPVCFTPHKFKDMPILSLTAKDLVCEGKTDSNIYKKNYTSSSKHKTFISVENFSILERFHLLWLRKIRLHYLILLCFFGIDLGISIGTLVFIFKGFDIRPGCILWFMWAKAGCFYSWLVLSVWLDIQKLI